MIVAFVVTLGMASYPADMDDFYMLEDCVMQVVENLDTVEQVETSDPWMGREYPR